MLAVDRTPAYAVGEVFWLGFFEKYFIAYDADCQVNKRGSTVHCSSVRTNVNIADLNQKINVNSPKQGKYIPFIVKT